MVLDFLDTEPAVAAIIIYDEEQDAFPGDPWAPQKAFMKQIERLDNACGLIAWIHAIFNTEAQ